MKKVILGAFLVLAALATGCSGKSSGDGSGDAEAVLGFVNNTERESKEVSSLKEGDRIRLTGLCVDSDNSDKVKVLDLNFVVNASPDSQYDAVVVGGISCSLAEDPSVYQEIDYVGVKNDDSIKFYHVSDMWYETSDGRLADSFREGVTSDQLKTIVAKDVAFTMSGDLYFAGVDRLQLADEELRNITFYSRSEYENAVTYSFVNDEGVQVELVLLPSKSEGVVWYVKSFWDSIAQESMADLDQGNLDYFIGLEEEGEKCEGYITSSGDIISEGGVYGKVVMKKCDGFKAGECIEINPDGKSIILHPLEADSDSK